MEIVGKLAALEVDFARGVFFTFFLIYLPFLYNHET